MKELGIGFSEYFQIENEKKDEEDSSNKNEENNENSKETNLELKEKLKNIDEEFKKSSLYYDNQIQNYVEIINMKNETINDLKNQKKNHWINTKKKIWII